MTTDEVWARYVTSEAEEVCVLLPQLDARQVVDGLPVREFPVYKGRKSYSGHFWSATMGQHVMYESRLELSWLWLADFDPAVTAIAAQPLILQGADGGRPRTRYPDFLCTVSDGQPLVVDVKPREAAAKPEVQDSLAWTERVVRERGWRYQVWTGADPTVLRNVWTVASGRRLSPQDAAVRQVAQVLADHPVRLGDLEAQLTRESAPRLLVMAALWHGSARCDMSVPLSSDSILETA